MPQIVGVQPKDKTVAAFKQRCFFIHSVSWGNLHCAPPEDTRVNATGLFNPSVASIAQVC